MSTTRQTNARDPRTPAEVYDAQFVPALFRPWAAKVCDLARIAPGQRVLDVACGTGALTSVAAERVQPGGVAIGLDASAEMLAVARRKDAPVEWREGRAEALPFPDASFDRVVSQFGLMFFADRALALREMQRVLKPGGRLAVAVCDGLERSPGYAALAALLERLFGSAVADAFRAPFALGDADRLRALCAEAGLAGAEVARLAGEVRFESVDALVATERACAWTLGGLLDDAQFERLRAEAQQALAPFVDASGGAVFAMPALVIGTGSAALDAVRRIYADFAAGDVASVLGALAADVEWSEADGSPYAGTYRSAREVCDGVFARLAADWHGFEVRPVDFIADGPRIVALGTYCARHAASGKPFEAPFAHAWWCADGKVLRFRQYTDTALMRDAMR